MDTSLIPVVLLVMMLVPEKNRISNNSNNIYDMLILFHDEYATQEMYDNYRRFVSNGGTILFIDANVFIAEVDYDKENQTISLTKGHDWEFVNGTFARKSVIERWFNENKEWMGSNFLVSEITSNVTFANNPFNYTHFEENYVNNPDAKILIDYDIVLPKKNPYAGLPVAKRPTEVREWKCCYDRSLRTTVNLKPGVYKIH